MTSFWRQVGVNYIRYSQICASALRRSVKPQFQSADAARKETSAMKITKWSGGKPVSADDIETLAWSTAQIHCQCTLNADSTRSGTNSIDISSIDGSADAAGQTYFHPTLGERGVTVMMTQPRILFCNIKLAPGESVEYQYKEKIPLLEVGPAPPTFRGVFVKYAYKLTIGTQRPDTPISEIKIPFRVLTVEGMKDISSYTDKAQELAPSNPFQVCDREDNHKPEHTVREIALQLLSEQSNKRRNNCYNISNLKGKVARITMPKSNYKIGEDLYCTVDFADATVQCLQINLTLQSVEELAEEYRKEGQKHLNVLNHANHQEFCLHITKANISLPIPLHITPSFKSDFVVLKWRLHVEFVTLTKPVPEQTPPVNDSSGVLWHGVSDLETETMHWHLPITVLSNNPLQCGIVQSLKSDDCINLD